MKIMVIGATGRVGQKLVAMLATQGHTVYAATRTPVKLNAQPLIIPTFLDLHDEQTKIEQAMRGIEAVYFVAGSRGSDLLQTDLNGAVKIMQAAKNLHITRFIQLSTIYSLLPTKWPHDMQDYYIAKYFSDEWLIHNSGLTYTILQPGPLTEQIGSGRVTLNTADAKTNSIDNVVAVLVASLNLPQTYQQVISMADGPDLVKTALVNFGKIRDQE